MTVEKILTGRGRAAARESAKRAAPILGCRSQWSAGTAVPVPFVMDGGFCVTIFEEFGVAPEAVQTYAIWPGFDARRR